MEKADLDRPRSGTVARSLWQFAYLCNKEAPHSRDWRRFYMFTLFAHAKRVGWDEYDLRAKLKKLGFDEKHAADFSNAYWHIRCALHMSKSRPLTESYCAWIRTGGTRST
jgi:hypothetical protein